MKAVVWSAYGAPDVLKVRQLPTPKAKANQVRIKVHATTAFPADCEMRRFEMPTPALWLPVRLFFGVFKPRGTKILGQEFAGVIESVGEKVTRFKVGDEVFGCTGAEFGGYAEYIVRNENSALAIKPKNVSFDQIVPFATGASNAQHYLQSANLKEGDKVLINGAAGCIGSFAVQMAKCVGAHVIAVDSADKLSFLHDLGADEVLDYKSQNPLKDGPYDLIFDVVGKLPYPACLKRLSPNGKYASANPHLSQVIRAKGKPVILSLAEPTAESLSKLAEWAEDGWLKAHIDKRFDLTDAASAHRYVESGEKLGHVVLSVS